MSSPAEQQLDAALLSRTLEAARRDLPALTSLLVARHGHLVTEYYAGGSDNATAFNVKSVTKTVLSALTGAAILAGRLGGVEQAVGDILPEYVTARAARPELWSHDVIARNNALRRRLTVEHLLTMTAGFAWQEDEAHLLAFFNSSDPVRFTLDLPFTSPPGTAFEYSSAAVHVLAAVIARSTGMSVRAFAEARLFEPLGIAPGDWAVDPRGLHFGSSELWLRARDMLKLGLLHLNEGSYDGTRILPTSWVQTSFEPHARAERDARFAAMIPGSNGYGYLWWRRRAGETQMFCALGLGGQSILVAPALDMVITTTSSLDPKTSPGNDEQFRAIFHLVDRYVVGAVAAAGQ